MDIVSALILGIVQGLTEFLPVSSTGHLILMREVLGIQTESGLAVDAVLHLATAAAVAIYFRRDFVRLARQLTGGATEETVADRTLLWALVLGTIPAVIIGLLFEDAISTAARSAAVVAWGLIAGSVVFAAAEYALAKMPRRPLSIGRGAMVGMFQALALIPGFSRSGSTISGGMLLGLTREEAARFAFLLSFPIILGAGSLKAIELGLGGFFGEFGGALMVGALAAFLTGLFAIHWMLRFVANNSLGIFIAYRIALAAFILLTI